MARTIDGNGWLQVIGNPITKAGVFPYLGSEIGAPDPDRIYRVYRPEEELQRPETLDSFKLLPFVDEHAPLGSKGIPAEQKGIQGMIGEQVFWDPPYVRGNLKVLSNAALAQIGAGKIQLSPGYSCRYDFTPGVTPNGEAYDARQVDIRGNHLALVDEGRTGPDVAVQDRKPEFITLDTARLLPMEFTDEQIEQIKAIVAELLAAQTTGDEDPAKEPTEDQDVIEEVVTAEQGAAAEVAAAAAEEAKARIDEAEAVLGEVSAAVDAVEEASEAVAMASDDKSRKIAMDSLKAAKGKLTAARNKQAAMTQDGALKVLAGKVDKLTKQLAEKSAPVAMDTAALLEQIGKRDNLASRLSHFVGSFDASTMTLDSVAKYGIEKLGLEVPAGSELVALDAWLHNRTPDHKNILTADKAPRGDAFKQWEQK